jgi:hypothetical protein
MMWGERLGLSAQAIAGGGNNHPWDPGDLRRCMEYCDAHGITTEQLRQRMSNRSTEWGRLVPEWDHLTQLLRHEMTTRTDGRAPRTYQEMKRVLAAGIVCPTCSGTGRGVECTKCKGTGRRSGGRCRAKGCYQGADFCPTCNGRGHTLPA